MKGYLSQIASAGGKGPAPTLRPFIRSRSPIAESDQRIGISEWEVPLSLEEGEGLPADPGVADDTTAAKAGMPPAGLRQASAKRPAVKPASEPLSARGETSGDTPIRPVSDETKPYSLDSASKKPPVQSSRDRRENSGPQAPHRETEGPVIRRLHADSGGEGEHGDPSAVAPISRQAATSVTPPSHQEPRLAERRHDPPSVVDEPTGRNLEGESREPAAPRVVPPPKDQRMSRSPATETSMAGRREDVSPARPSVPAAIPPGNSPPAQVVIDRLEIEVVPPAPQPSPKPAAQSGDRTEAVRPQRSVSKIGPLSPSTAFRHYLSLRYR
jgi:hypothetical protein